MWGAAAWLPMAPLSEAITGYYLENLPQALQEVFIPQERLALGPEEMRAFASRLGIPGAERDKQTSARLISLASRIQARLDAAGRFPQPQRFAL